MSTKTSAPLKRQNGMADDKTWFLGSNEESVTFFKLVHEINMNGKFHTLDFNSLTYDCSLCRCTLLFCIGLMAPKRISATRCLSLWTNSTYSCGWFLLPIFLTIFMEIWLKWHHLDRNVLFEDSPWFSPILCLLYICVCESLSTAETKYFPLLHTDLVIPN